MQEKNWDLTEETSELSTEKEIPNAPDAPGKDYVFALDIGTRDIIGVVGIPEDDKLRVEAVESAEHTKRAMIDGQIEDIDQVARVAALVKEKLEKKLGYPLKRVCVAAAGRALKTQRATYEIELDGPENITDELICRLEAGAVQSAEKQFEPGADQDDQRMFFLVGYSVVQYCLDNYPMSTLLDHRGQRISVDLIATFLPREVVNSLYTSMRKAGLEIASLTLEPIAAINAAIPQNLRLLNLALVDIGAGTSDIAISRDGSIVAYTMATVAGDEITEAVMKKYLVDFPVAESVKLQLSQDPSGDKEITFQDILGFPHAITPDDVKETIEPVTRDLCQEIGERILQANGGSAPSAVFLVGGGSKLPGLCRAVADYLKMDGNRVAVGGNNFSMSVTANNMDVSGPEYATPLGIALSTALNLINDSFSITLNGENAKLFRSGKLTALDVLMMNGYSYSQLISRSGQSVAIEVDGAKRVIRGTHSMPASLFINGRESKLSSIVKAGDCLDFVAAVSGEDAHPCLEDVVNFEYTGRVTFLDSVVSLGTHANVNGEPSHPRRELEMHDKVRTFRVRLLGDLLEAIDENPDGRVMLVNGGQAGLDSPLADGDVITYEDGGGRTLSPSDPIRLETEANPPSAPVPHQAPVPDEADSAASSSDPVPPADGKPDVPDFQADPETEMSFDLNADLEFPPVEEVPAAEEVSAVELEPLPEQDPSAFFDDAKGFTPADFMLDDGFLDPFSATPEEIKPSAPPDKAPSKTDSFQTPPEEPVIAPMGEASPPSDVFPENTADQKGEALSPPAELEKPEPEAPDSNIAAPNPDGIFTEELDLTPDGDALFHFTLNGAPLSIKGKPDGTPYMLLDMLNLVDIDLSKPQGRIVLRVNGRDAPYRFELCDRDTIEIHWEKR